MEGQQHSMACAQEHSPHKDISVALFAGKTFIIQAYKERGQNTRMYNDRQHNLLDEVDDVIIDGVYLAMENGLPMPDNFMALTATGLTYIGRMTDSQESDA
jgi:hypothetical protein